MAEVKSGQRDAGPRFKLHEREKWLHEFRVALRARSRFAEQMVEQVHVAPAHVAGADVNQEHGEEFVLGRVDNSTRGSLLVGSDEDTPSSDEEFLSRQEQLELATAVQAAVRLATNSVAGGESKESGAASAPTAAPEGAFEGERAAATTAAAGSGLAAQPAGSGGMRGRVTPPVIDASNRTGPDAHREEPAPAVPPASPAIEGGGEEASGVISFSITPAKGDMPHTGGPTRRETVASRMSTLMKGLQTIRSRGAEALNRGASEHQPQPTGATQPQLQPETKRDPSHWAIPTDATNRTHAATELLQQQILAWYQRLIQRKRTHRSRRGRSRARTPRRAQRRHTGEAYLKRMKLVAALSKRGMAPEDFLSLESSLQLELWEHCNEIIYQMIAKSLGHKYNYLLARVAAGDGMKAYQSIKLLDNESTMGAKNQFLSDLMRLTMRATGTRDTPANMMTYYDKLIELDSKYKLANNGIGVDRDVLRTKLLELPSAYDKAVEFIEQDDAMCRRHGREPMTCQAIVDYVNLFENTKKRKDRQGNNGFHRKLGRRGRALWAQGKEQSRRPKPAAGHRSGGNPLRNLRGRNARMAERRVRNGTQNKKEKTCYHCGEAGHFKRDCPKLQKERPRSKAYKAKTAPVRPPRNHVGLVLRVVPQTSGAPPRALSAQSQQSLVLDSGATGHFVPESIRLENQRPTRKNVQGAGQEVMEGLAEGDLGSLKGVLRVEGLNQGLISVAQITQRHNACVVFSSDRAYLIPQWVMARFLRNNGWVASLQGETGLYHTDPKRVEAAIRRLLPQPKAKRMLHREPDGRALNTLATVAAKAAVMPTGLADGAAESKAGADAGRPPLKRAKTVPANLGTSPSANLLGKSANQGKAPGSPPSFRRKDPDAGRPRSAKWPRSRSLPRIGAWLQERPRVGISFGGELQPDGVMKCITREEAESAGSAHGTNLPPKATRRRWTNHRVLMNTEIARDHDEATERRQREMQVLVLASTGDLALANLVATRFDIDWNRVREEMKGARNHWAKKAAYATILTCNKCLLPGWPDCDCCVEADGAEPSVRSHKMERAYNYVDKPPSNPAVLFHRRMGHMTVPRMIQAFKDGGDHGIEGLTIKAIREMPWCQDCAACKQTRKGHSRRAKGRKRSTVINEVIHTDTMERTIASLPPGRFTKIQTFVDECTRYLWVRFFRRKTASEFTTMLESFENQAQIQHRKSVQWKGGPGTPVLSYFSDNASELVARDQKERLAEKLIELKLSTPGESAANGIAERANRTILETTRVLLYQAGLPLPFWHLAANMAVYILNRSPSRNNPGNKSPYELYYGKAPDRSKIRRFGCRCWVWQDKDSRPNRSKLDPTATPMMFAGYVDHNTHGFLVWDPITHQVKVRYSLIFEEDANLGITIGSAIYKLPGGKQKNYLHLSSNVNDTGTPERVDSNPLMLESMADDGWNQIYTADDEETLNDIGRRLGVDPTELQQKNVGIVGSDRETGLLPLDAPLEKGTELWIPSKIEKEAEPEQIEENSQSEDEAPPEEWKSRLRSRKRRALKVSYDKAPNAKLPTPAKGPWGPAGALRCELLKTQRDIEDLLTENDSVPRMTEMIAALNLQGPADEHEVKSNKWLHENCAKSAARHNRPKCLRWALGNGADVDTTTKSGNSLLHLAAFTGSAGMCQMLLEHGSDPETVNKRGEKPDVKARHSVAPETHPWAGRRWVQCWAQLCWPQCYVL